MGGWEGGWLRRKGDFHSQLLTLCVYVCACLYVCVCDNFLSKPDWLWFVRETQLFCFCHPRHCVPLHSVYLSYVDGSCVFKPFSAYVCASVDSSHSWVMLLPVVSAGSFRPTVLPPPLFKIAPGNVIALNIGRFCWCLLVSLCYLGHSLLDLAPLFSLDRSAVSDSKVSDVILVASHRFQSRCIYIYVYICGDRCW